MSFFNKLFKKDYQKVTDRKTAERAAKNGIDMKHSNVNLKYSCFKTRPFLLVGKSNLKSIHIPMIPNWTDKVFKALNKYKCKYMTISPDCILLLNYQSSAYHEILKDPIGKDFKKYFEPLTAADSTFTSWLRGLPIKGYKVVGYSYHGHNVHTKFSKHNQGFTSSELTELVNKIKKQGFHYEFLQFMPMHDKTIKKGQIPPKFVISADGSITNFSHQSNLTKLTKFVKALLNTY